MRKTVSIILTLALLVFAFGISAFAQTDKATVYAQRLTAQKGESQLVYINIDGNPGLMGFKIHLAYIEEYVSVKSVTRGEVTKQGSFMTNLGLKSGGFDIVWTNTQQIDENGIIAILSLDVLTDEPFEIYISYSENDTFNEAYANIALDCRTIPSANYVSNSETSDTEHPNYTPEYTDELGELVIDEVIGDAGLENINELDDSQKEKILSDVNEQIKDRFGVDEAYKSFSEIEKTYKDYLNDTIITDIAALEHGKQAKDIVETVIESQVIVSVDDTTVNKVFQELEKNGLSEKYRKVFSLDELKTIVNSLTEDSISDNSSYDHSTISQKLIIIIAAAVVFAVVLGLSVFLLLKHIKKRKGENE